MTEPVTVTMSATIPTQQYGNLSPTFQVTAETYDDAFEKALTMIKDVWDRTAPKPLDVRDLDTFPRLPGEELRCWASGTRVKFDPIEHTYSTPDGKRWLSGSTFAGRYKSGFNGSAAAGAMSKKYGVEAAQILDMWDLNRDASATVGTAVHTALELRGKYGDLSRAVKDGSLESAVSKNPILAPIVESFFEGRDDEDARYEVFVADPVRAHCGQIDRLRLNADGTVDVEDYKTNADLDKKETIQAPFKGLVPNTQLGAFWLQLSFYARILKSHGKTVKLLRVHHWDGSGWQSYEHEPIDLDAVFAAKDSHE